MIYRYWYKPDTGEIVRRSKTGLVDFDMPYIEHEEFDYYNYRVDVETQELVYEPNENIGVDRRRRI